MKAIVCCVIGVLVGSSILCAQDTSATTKVDTILLYQKEILTMQQKIYSQVQETPPLANKSVGIELNFARLLVSSGRDYFTLSGTFSLFSVLRSGEIAFPFFYQHGESERTESFTNVKYKVPLTLLNLDATYRHFLGKMQDGFYFSVGTRYTYIKGMTGNDLLFASRGTLSSVAKVGAYFGIGYRYFTKSGFYWGVSLIYGRYFSGERDFQEVLLDDSKIILDTECLKFGYAF